MIICNLKTAISSLTVLYDFELTFYSYSSSNYYFYKKLKIMSEVSNSSAESNVCCIDRITDLHRAVIHNHVRIVKQLLTKGVDVNANNRSCGTPLHTAVIGHISENIELVELLLNSGADVNGKDRHGRSPLHVVVSSEDIKNRYEFAEMLLKNGADVNARDKLGETPLHKLVQIGNLKTVKLLLNYKADVNVVDDKGNTLFFMAIQNVNTDSTEILQLLIDLGLDVNHRRSDGETSLHEACCLDKCYNIFKATKYLLKNGANMSAIDNEKHTPLGRFILYLNVTGVLPMVKGVKFIIEHANWNVPEELNFLDSSDRMHHDLREVILNHVAKLEVLNFPVNPIFLDTISQYSFYDNYYKECKEELLKAKKTKLKNTWITFYNLLMDSRKALKNYAGNEDLIKNFIESNSVEKFPIYGVQMCENVKKGIERRDVFDKSTDLLSNCLPIFNPTHLVIKDILDCILSKKDLSKFCE